MKNNKGFTLTEILATLVIIGIIVAIAIPSFNKLSKQFEKDYYNSLEDTILASAKNYYKDHPEERPTGNLYSSAITLTGLKDKKYVDNAKVYNSDKDCTGYVVVVKENDKYNYVPCMKCNDSFDTSDENMKYCSNEDLVTDDSNKFITIEENSSEVNTIINSSKGIKTIYCRGEQELSTDKLLLAYVENFSMTENYAAYIKKNLTVSMGQSRGGNISCTTGGEKTLYEPINISDIKLNKKNTYKVKYKGIDDLIEIEIYKPSIPIYEDGKLKIGDSDYSKANLKFVGFEKENNLGTFICSDKETDCTGAEQGTSYRAVFVDKDDPYASKYGYFYSGYKIIESNNINIPTCKFVINTKDENGWYKDDVVIELNPSDEHDYGIRKVGDSDYKKQKTYTYTIEGTNTLKLEGYVKDAAGNEGTCTFTQEIKLDKTKPTCQLKSSQPTGDNGWYINDVVVNISKSEDVTFYGISNSNTPIYNSEDKYIFGTEGKDLNLEVYGYVKDAAGNEGRCTLKEKVNVDTEVPECRLAISGMKENGNYISDVTVSFEYIPKAIAFGITTKSTSEYNCQNIFNCDYVLKESAIVYGYAKDEAGNEGKCQKKITIERPSDPSDIEVNIPGCNTDLVYNGTEQTLIESANQGYMLSNNKQTNAGTYKVEAVLEKGYKWSDQTTSEKTFNCSIGKRKIKFASGSASKNASDEPLTKKSASIVEGSLATGETTKFSNWASQDGIGKKDNTFEAKIYTTDENNETTSNYEIEYVYGTLTMKQMYLQTIITDINYNDYDGNWTNKAQYVNVFIKPEYTEIKSVIIDGEAISEPNIQDSNDMNSHYANHNNIDYKNTGYYRYFKMIDKDVNSDIKIVIEDTDGFEVEITKTLKIDKLVPKIPTLQYNLDSYTGALYTPGDWTNKTVYRQIKSRDEGSGIDHFEYKNAGVLDTTCSGNKKGNESLNNSSSGIENDVYYQISYSPTDENRACFRAVDKVGNTSEWTSIQKLLIDKTPPRMSITYNNNSYDDQVDYNDMMNYDGAELACIDNAPSGLSVDAFGWSNVSYLENKAFFWKYLKSSTAKKITANCIDRAGNMSNTITINK